MAKELTQAIVTEWVESVRGTFDIKDIFYEVGIETPENKKKLRVYLSRLEERETLVYLGGNRYRKRDMKAEKIEWEKADPTKTIPLKFPFNEQEFCQIYPKSIIIVAGSKNTGKTEYLYTFLKLNIGKFPIDLFNSETSPEQMKGRFLSHGITSSEGFDVYERYDNFADVIHPNRISIIDYLDLNSEVYLVGTEIDQIFRKLKTGVAIIGLQKPPPSSFLMKNGEKKIIDRDLAYGGGFTAKRAALYLSLSINKFKLVYVKTPKKGNVNPQNMTFTFNIDEEGHFTNIQRYYGGEY